MRLLLAALLCLALNAAGAPPRFTEVMPGHALSFPQDFGVHSDYRNEWWYVTGWLQTTDGKPLGFQVTFFRFATEHDAANPSRFAPKQLIVAHAALSDPAVGKLLHDQKSAREGFGIAYAREGNTDVKLDNWKFVRSPQGQYRTDVTARDFTLQLDFAPSQPIMLQGENGFSRKGPQPQQASYYYSEPQLHVTGAVTRGGKTMQVTGTAWLDHEWSTAMLDPDASGWDWLGASLDDGSALMAFRIRSKNGATLWAHASLRDGKGNTLQYAQQQIRFLPLRNWQSPHTEASYPVEMQIETGKTTWKLTPLLDDQELDTRQSAGAVYWEGAVTVTRDGNAAGRGYLELTGYVKPLKL